MEKDYQNNNSISDAANNNEESNKPEHEIKVEIVSIEVVGEDTPPKHSKKYERWGTTALLSFVVWVACIGYCANNPQSTACWPLSSHQHCFSYLLGKWCFLVPKNSFTEYFSRFLFSSTLSLYALNLRPKSPQKTLLLVQFFLLSWKEEKYVGEKFFLTYDRIMITTGICPKTFAPIYPHYKSFDSYLKPQPTRCQVHPLDGCISFDSYIKPQLPNLAFGGSLVVYLLIPTSNHNLSYT